MLKTLRCSRHALLPHTFACLVFLSSPVKINVNSANKIKNESIVGRQDGAIESPLSVCVKLASLFMWLQKLDGHPNKVTESAGGLTSLPCSVLTGFAEGMAATSSFSGLHSRAIISQWAL